MTKGKISPLTLIAIDGAIHHALLQTLYTDNKFQEIMIVRGLARLRLKRDYGINVNKIKNRAMDDIKSGCYEDALKRTAEYSRSTVAVVGEVARLLGITIEEEA